VAHTNINLAVTMQQKTVSQKTATTTDKQGLGKEQETLISADKR